MGAAATWFAVQTPSVAKRTPLLGKLKAVFRSRRSEPVAGVIEQINPILRGWVNYFAYGNRTSGFS